MQIWIQAVESIFAGSVEWTETVLQEKEEKYKTRKLIRDILEEKTTEYWLNRLFIWKFQEHYWMRQASKEVLRVQLPKQYDYEKKYKGSISNR